MNEYTTPSGLQRWLGNGYNMAGLSYSGAAFADLAAASSEYNQGQIAGQNYRIQAANLRGGADDVEIAAADAANALRKKYLAAIGSATYSAAARGADVNAAGGILQSDLEKSSMELGDDMATIERNANRRAKTMRTQADIYEKMSKAYGKSSKWMMYSKMFSGISNLGMGLAMFGAGSGAKGMATPYGDAIDPGQVASANNMLS